MSGDRWIDRRRAVEIVSDRYFPVTKRAVERWPISGRILNRRFLMRERDVIAHVEGLLRNAPAARGGRGPS